MDEPETFCIYCQKEYARPLNLESHVLRQHPGTYRAFYAVQALSVVYQGIRDRYER